MTQSWTLSAEGAVPAENAYRRQELEPGRHRRTYSLVATVLTELHRSWLRRDYAWCAIPILLAVLCDAH